MQEAALEEAEDAAALAAIDAELAALQSSSGTNLDQSLGHEPQAAPALRGRMVGALDEHLFDSESVSSAGISDEIGSEVEEEADQAYSDDEEYAFDED